MPRKLFSLLPCALLIIASCSAPRYPVEGKVTINGKPLKTGTVVLWTDGGKEERSNRLPTAQIGEDGSYSVYTEGVEGAPVGTYKVTVYAEELADSTKYAGKNPEKTKVLVHRKYTQAETTPLSIKVVQFPDKGAYDLPLSTK
jgi:hypothetical protein